MTLSNPKYTSTELFGLEPFKKPMARKTSKLYVFARFLWQRSGNEQQKKQLG